MVILFGGLWRLQQQQHNRVATKQYSCNLVFIPNSRGNPESQNIAMGLTTLECPLTHRLTSNIPHSGIGECPLGYRMTSRFVVIIV